MSTGQHSQPFLRDLAAGLAEYVEAGEWWPAQSRFEIVIGAILTQNTAWTNVERALAQLREAGYRLDDPSELLDTPTSKLAELTRPAGSFTRKASYLHAIATWFQSNDAQAQHWPTERLRASLLAVRGVGEETADSIAVYVYRRPLMIYDAYARRLFAAVGLGDFPSYRQAKLALDPLAAAANFAAQELAEFHGRIVDAGKLARSLGGWDAALPQLPRIPRVPSSQVVRRDSGPPGPVRR